MSAEAQPALEAAAPPPGSSDAPVESPVDAPVASADATPAAPSEEPMPSTDAPPSSSEHAHPAPLNAPAEGGDVPPLSTSAEGAPEQQTPAETSQPAESAPTTQVAEDVQAAAAIHAAAQPAQQQVMYQWVAVPVQGGYPPQAMQGQMRPGAPQPYPIAPGAAGMMYPPGAGAPGAAAPKGDLMKGPPRPRSRTAGDAATAGGEGAQGDREAREALKDGMPALADCAKAPDESCQCTKNDGRGWRCPKVIMEGKTLCDYHWYRLKNRRELIAEEKVANSDGREPKARKEIGKRGKPLKDGMPALADCEKAMDKSEQCVKSDGRGWRCSKVVMAGKTLCAYHWYRLINKRELEAEQQGEKLSAEKERKLRKSVGQRGTPLKDGMPSLADCPKAPDISVQCERNDGRGWRCSKQVMAGKALCEYHWYRLINQREIDAEQQSAAAVAGALGESKDGIRTCNKSDGRGWRCSK
eukprot:CAMPEP_0118930034 /NCGR_PEP_ID=MMETSP1169-20130426/6855_1 /TAXON_ID=36882 /ORGANISM="Pyramimonas obovata, Strain CCMP722" /LENGTH=468 /DNA_ID=CAMNT_0006872329 /DNA_START=179 /DNA_END=1583 /DNA_ORIENTATION=+